MSHRVLVTGAEGFVGRLVCAYLRERGYEVRGCDVLVPREDTNHTACNITEPKEIERLIEWCGPADYVLHLAAITFVPEAQRTPARVMEVNLGGTIRLAGAVQQYWPDARFLFVSSSEVYGMPQYLPLDELHPMAPENPYAISKAAADRYCHYLHKQRGFDAVILRPFNHAGAGQSDRFALSSFARQIADIEAGNAPPVLHVGNLKASRDFSHVHDIVRAYELALRGAAAGEAYNLCAGMAHSLQHAVETLVRMSHVEIEIQVDPERMRPSDVPELWGSYEKFHAATGWEPELGFETLLAEQLDFWRAQARRD